MSTKLEPSPGVHATSYHKQETPFHSLRHIVYCLSDILLEFLIPDSQTDELEITPGATSGCGVAESAGPSSH
ncbi:hypothetical protein JD844_031381 [Phrynosoma platyrhinos]|uniref:Uncharacterized protein n=1 Tax=Phrynosoma platyrhinos TaxID=52577 RepID=A0ABQ7T1A0_PHRPL|nr:hypothetical protein JD844_031381 [Phrynosoma platyrhinos]